MQYSISHFAQKTGISAYTLRYYEKEHLLTPQRHPNGRRFYTQQDLSWVDFIKRLKETGMPIRQIQQYAQLRAQGSGTLEDRQQILLDHQQQVKKTVTLWQTHLKKLNQKITFYENEIRNANQPNPGMRSMLLKHQP